MSGIHVALIGSTGNDALIAITNRTISAFVFPPNTAEAGYRLGADGKVYKYENGVFTEIETWCTPTSQASNYEARVTVNSGSTPTGSVGTWAALSSTRSWTISETTSGVNNLSNFNVEIRRTGTTTVLDSAVIDLTAGVF